MAARNSSALAWRRHQLWLWQQCVINGNMKHRIGDLSVASASYRGIMRNIGVISIENNQLAAPAAYQLSRSGEKAWRNTYHHGVSTWRQYQQCV